jgi:hypothetical protein
MDGVYWANLDTHSLINWEEHALLENHFLDIPNW